MLRILVICVFTCCAPGMSYANKTNKDMPRAASLSLVEMVTSSVSNNGGLTKYKLRILKVYVGDQGFLGERVLLKQPSSGASNQGSIAFLPHLKTGELLIGFVHLDNDKASIDAPANLRMTGWTLNWIPLPVRSGTTKGGIRNEQFMEAVKWANIYKDFVAVPEKNKHNFLKDILRRGIPVISKWPAHLLGEKDGTYENLDILEKIVQSEKSLVISRLYADWALDKNQLSNWHASKERKRFLVALSKRNLESSELDAFVDNVRLSIQRKDFSVETYMAIIAELEKHKKKSNELARSIKSLRWRLDQTFKKDKKSK